MINSIVHNSLYLLYVQSEHTIIRRNIIELKWWRPIFLAKKEEPDEWKVAGRIRDLRVIFVSRARLLVSPFFVSWSVNGKWFIFLRLNGKIKMPQRTSNVMQETLSWSEDNWLSLLIKARSL